MVGILLSYWDGLFSGAFAVSFREGNVDLVACWENVNMARYCGILIKGIFQVLLGMVPPFGKLAIPFP